MSRSSADLLAGAEGKLQVLICHSREDQAIGFESAKTAHETLKTAGIQSRLVPYSGGHAITTELVQTIALWIAHPGRLEEPRGGN